MLNSDSDISAEFDSFLANIDIPHTRLATPETQEWESFLEAIPSTTSVMPIDQTESVLSLSPKAQEWNTFLSSVRTSPKTFTIPPESSDSEHDQSDSEPPQDSSSNDDYHPSPVPIPVLYEPSSDDGNDNILHIAGEWSAESLQIF
jgi:hypothetical protein